MLRFDETVYCSRLPLSSSARRRIDVSATPHRNAELLNTAAGGDRVLELGLPRSASAPNSFQSERCPSENAGADVLPNDEKQVV